MTKAKILITIFIILLTWSLTACEAFFQPNNTDITFSPPNWILGTWSGTYKKGTPIAKGGTINYQKDRTIIVQFTHDDVLGNIEDDGIFRSLKTIKDTLQQRLASSKADTKSPLTITHADIKMYDATTTDTEYSIIVSANITYTNTTNNEYVIMQLITKYTFTKQSDSSATYTVYGTGTIIENPSNMQIPTLSNATSTPLTITKK